MSLRFPFVGPRMAPRDPVVDGVPCRPYRVGEHAATISAMLLRRLVLAAVIAAALSVLLPLAITLASQGGAGAPATVPALARLAGSPIIFDALLLGVDFLLIRGRLAAALSMLTWTGRLEADELRATTGLRRPANRPAAQRWLAEHPPAESEPEPIATSRAYLQIVTGELAGARVTIGRMPRGTPEQAVRSAALEAAVDLAAGQPFDAVALRAQVEALADPGLRAVMAAEVGALVAQGRFTCHGDHLAALDWARPLIGRRDAGQLLRGYWLPIGALVVITSVVLAFVFPVSS